VSRFSTDRLGIVECRRLIGRGCQLDDDAVLALRDQLYTLARVAVSEHLSAIAAWNGLDESERIDAEEHAAILHFEGRVPRAEADRLALTHARRHRKQ
jgi:hypothetical protein